MNCTGLALYTHDFPNLNAALTWFRGGYMNLKFVFTAAFATSVMAAPMAAMACGGSLGWENPAASAAAVSLDQAIETAQTEFSLKIKESEYQARCGSDLEYTVIDGTSNEQLGTIPVPREAVSQNDGRALIARVQQLLQSPREQLIRLGKARALFYEDTQALKEELGISAYVPNAYPIEKRITNGGQDYLLFLTVESYCSGRGLQSPFVVSQNFHIKTLEYIPGRTEYPASSIYAKGDFRKAVFENTEALSEVKSHVVSNARFCSDDEYGKRNFWVEVANRLSGPASELFKNSVERFQDLVERPTSAHMLNGNLISIQYASGERQFAGAVEEMVEIQTLLAKQGVKVNKLGRLNQRGRISVQIAREYKRELPASLQE
jgi:hypothetical protein